MARGCYFKGCFILSECLLFLYESNTLDLLKKYQNCCSLLNTYNELRNNIKLCSPRLYIRKKYHLFLLFSTKMYAAVYNTETKTENLTTSTHIYIYIRIQIWPQDNPEKIAYPARLNQIVKNEMQFQFEKIIIYIHNVVDLFY